MGSRGAFLDVSSGDFTFKENGETFLPIGHLSSNENVVVLVRKGKNSVKAPEYSPTPKRIYAVVQGNSLKHLVYYGKNRLQKVCVDFLHRHNGVQPHVHFNLNHDKKSPGIPPEPEQLELAQQIRKEFNLR